MSDTPLSRIQRSSPFGRITPRKPVTFNTDDLRPLIRIAHRVDRPLNIAQRIIFDHELVLILEGTGKFHSNGTSTAFAARDLLFIRPFVPHSFTSTQPGGAHLAVHFDFARQTPPLTDHLDRRRPYEIQFTHGLIIPAQIRLTRNHPIETLFTNLVREYSNRPDPLALIAAENSLSSILITLFRTRAEVTPDANDNWRDRTRVQNVRDYIEKNLAVQIEAEELARVAGVSAGRLNLLFRKVTGYSLMDYLRRARVEKARLLLGDVRLSVKEVAALVGFDDAYHFSKVFRRIDGLSPVYYREALLAGKTETNEIDIR